MECLVLRGVVLELQQLLPGSSISAITYVPQQTVILSCKNARQSFRLVICWKGPFDRIHLTAHHWSAAGSPHQKEPHFVQALKSHLMGAIIKKIVQTPFDRMVTFHFVTADSLDARLVIQLFGPRARCTLEIVDSAGHDLLFTTAQTRTKGIGGAPPSPALWWQQLSTLPVPKIVDEIKGCMHGQLIETQSNYAAFIRKHFPFVGKKMSREIMTGLDNKTPEESSQDTIIQRLALIIHGYASGNMNPIVRDCNNRSEGLVILPHSFAPMPNDLSFDSLCDACDYYYRELIKRATFAKQKMKIQKKLKKERVRLEKVLMKLERERAELPLAQKWRRYGDLLLASPHSRGKEKKLTEITVPNVFQSSDSHVTIPLDPSLTVVENAQRYYTRAAKLKRRSHHINERIAIIERKRTLLQQKLTELDACSDTLPESLMKELEERVPSIELKKKTTEKMDTASPFHRFRSQAGYLILVGRNARENDALTFIEAAPNDLWLHIRDAQGSHVVIKNPWKKKDIPPETILDAATLAGFYSKLKNDQIIEVMVTKRKFVKKAKNGPPGLVTVTREKNVTVRMEKKRLNRLFSDGTVV